MNRDFWRGRRVFLTGQTGFKGAWLAFVLSELGAEISGLALPPDGQQNLHDLLGIAARGRFVHADINDRGALGAALDAARPEIVVHLAAQALVRASYESPAKTFATNVLGSVTLLDLLRGRPDLRAVVMVTSDKVYRNQEWHWSYRESDPLGGHDPYSASKAACEIAVASMRDSFFTPPTSKTKIATVRAGNVIGGGDWAKDRLVPDLVRAAYAGAGPVMLRYPDAIRPWQHVLDPLNAYLEIAERLFYGEDGIDEAWNVGPMPGDEQPVRAVAEAVLTALGAGEIAMPAERNAPHEARLLQLDNARLRARTGWSPLIGLDAAIEMTADWYKGWAQGLDPVALTRTQVVRVFGDGR